MARRSSQTSVTGAESIHRMHGNEVHKDVWLIAVQCHTCVIFQCKLFSSNKMLVSAQYVYMALWVSQENTLWWIQNECECSLDNTPWMSVSVYVLVISATAIAKYFVSRIYNSMYVLSSSAGRCLPVGAVRTFVGSRALSPSCVPFLFIKGTFNGQGGWKLSWWNNGFTAFRFFLFSNKATELPDDSYIKPGERRVRIYLRCESPCCTNWAQLCHDLPRICNHCADIFRLH